jgi:hypothetical protein
MRIVAVFRFRYSAPLVPWTNAKLDRLHKVWLQVQRAAWRLNIGTLYWAAWRMPPGYPSAPLLFPSGRGGCQYPEALMVSRGAETIPP